MECNSFGSTSPMRVASALDPCDAEDLMKWKFAGPAAAGALFLVSALGLGLTIYPDLQAAMPDAGRVVIALPPIEAVPEGVNVSQTADPWVITALPPSAAEAATSVVTRAGPQAGIGAEQARLIASPGGSIERVRSAEPASSPAMAAGQTPESAGPRPADEAVSDQDPTARTIRVSVKSKRLEVIEDGVVIRTITDLSFGRRGHGTPLLEDGSLSMSRRIANYRSRKYHGAPMPHALFINEHPAIAFHAGNTKSSSHGCIRLRPEDAAWLFKWAGRDPVRVSIRPV